MQNGTYWAAARLLEREKHAKKMAGNKRKTVDGGETAADVGGAAKESATIKSKTEAKLLS